MNFAVVLGKIASSFWLRAIGVTSAPGGCLGFYRTASGFPPAYDVAVLAKS